MGLPLNLRAYNPSACLKSLPATDKEKLVINTYILELTE